MPGGQTVDKKLFSPRMGGRIALSANERIAEFLDFAIQARFAYVNKLPARFLPGGLYIYPILRNVMEASVSSGVVPVSASAPEVVRLTVVAPVDVTSV